MKQWHVMQVLSSCEYDDAIIEKKGNNYTFLCIVMKPTMSAIQIPCESLQHAKSVAHSYGFIME